MSLLSQIWQNNCAFSKSMKSQNICPINRVFQQKYRFVVRGSLSSKSCLSSKSGFSKASFDCTILFQHQDYLLMWFFVISVLSFCQLLRLQGDVHWGPLPVCPDLPGEVFGRVRRLWAGRLGGPRSQGTQGLPPQRSRPHEQGTIQRVSCVLRKLHGLLLTCRKLYQVFANQATFSKNWRKFCQLKTHSFLLDLCSFDKIIIAVALQKLLPNLYFH